MNEQILYRKSRDLGEIFGSSFKFIKIHFRVFYGSLLLFAGPFLIAGTLAYSYITRAAGASAFTFTGNVGYRSSTFLGTFMIAFFSLMIGASIYTVILNKNIITNESLEPGENLKLSHVSNGFFKDYWRMLLNVVLFSLVFLLALGFLFLLAVGIFALLKAISYTNSLSIAATIIMVIAFFLILFPVLCFIPTATVFVCQRDRINIFRALGKVLRYLKGNFWITWAFSVLALITYSIMAVIVQIPALIMTTISTFTRLKSTVGQGVAEDSTPVALIVVTVICTLLVYMVVAVFYLMNIYHYTSLEEKKEGSKLIEDINQIA